LRVPESEWDAIKKFTGTFRSDDSGEKTDIDKAPFRRYVDLWWAGMCLGVQENRRTKPNTWHTFVTGVVLTSDPWRILHLQLLAIAVNGDTKILKNPGEIITMANEFAATGIPTLVDAMTGQSEPIWGASQLLSELGHSEYPSDVNETLS
jgi:hypothetical protein